MYTNNQNKMSLPACLLAGIPALGHANTASALVVDLFNND